MAYLYPSTAEYTNDAERITYEALKNHLPNGYICYYNKKIDQLEFDFAVLVPGRGVIIIETKGYRADDILGIENDFIKLTSEENRFSPLKQADKYKKALFTLIKEQFGLEIPVFSVVCYPNLTAAEYKAKELNILSPINITICNDDINSSLSFKLEEAISSGIKQTEKRFDDFNIDAIFKLRSLFEPKESIEHNPVFRVRPKPVVKDRQFYSIFYYLPSNTDYKEFVKIKSELLDHWSCGTRVFIVSDSQDKLQQIKVEFNEYIRNLDAVSYEKFSLIKSDGTYKNTVFNLEFHYTDVHESKEHFIIDGNFDSEQKVLLEKLDATCDFNAAQYFVEHSQIEKNLMITAGAGTGKTTSMISRISYLIFRHNLDHITLPKEIVMITFTNEATKNMKRKLQDYFQNYYLLTLDYKYLLISECIESMQVTTIHKWSRAIIKQFSSALGLSNDFSIVSGNAQTQDAIDVAINKCLECGYKGNPYPVHKWHLSMYDINKRIKSLIGKIQSKNIDLLRDSLDFGDSFPNDAEFHHLLLSTIDEAEKSVQAQFDSENKIRLSDLILRLRQLVTESLDMIKHDAIKYKYLFVDEFQDTDNSQIDLFKILQDVFEFSFFAVGDVKQCIYRFRGAQDKAFDRLAPDKTDWLVLSLTKNYRTTKTLLTHFDKVFKSMSDRSLLQYSTSDVLRAVRKAKPSKCYVTINKAVATDLVTLIKRSLELRNDGEQIAILVRENKDVDVVKALCRQHGIFVKTDTGGNLYNIPPAIDLYKLILALQNSKNPKHIYNLYGTHYIEIGMPKAALFNKRKDMIQQMGIFNNQEPPIPNWEHYKAMLRKEPVLKIIKKIVDDIKPWEIYARTFETPYQLYQLAFYKNNLELLIENLSATTSDYLTLSRLEQSLQIMIMTSQSAEERENVDQNEDYKLVCSTVHKSKGLEYHTVILPFTNFTMNPKTAKGYVDMIAEGNSIGYQIKGNGYVCANKNYRQFMKTERFDRNNEEARILYVALTRAKDRVIFFAPDVATDTWAEILMEGN